ncbi:ParB/RepB/Spo0J family partition protein [Alkalicoccus halolimnae]|uniref:ParB/RepB/Spo0J family partition protein n=1 Tax=Alkalicoccus halolimnae TaxID=1667239 RepID=A0A5C7F9K0_9BACI|nr:ParB/RepB/Spo0J family partition protein [Alkalicoccus halolimnae]TXF86743.1 ParB/RepB/Spo0J family partition protein [Alkalicoccus halolimnae]
MGKGLGKGINAFFPNASKDTELQVEEIKLTDIRPNPYQPRKIFDETGLQELSESISAHGVIQPIMLRRSIKGYEIVVGERRFRASKLAGQKTIPAVVKELSDDEMMELALVENLQRENLNPLEEAKAYQKLMEHLQITQDDLAQRLGKSRPHIANYVRLLQLPLMVQEYLSEGKLTMGHARSLLGLKNTQQLSSLLQKIVQEQMSVRQLEEWVKRANQDVSRETKKKPAVSKLVKSRESQLKTYFGTNVQIKPGRKKGKIEIDYFNEEDLERIFHLLHKED